MSKRLLVVVSAESQRRSLREALPQGEFVLRFEPGGTRAAVCAIDWQPDCVIVEGSAARGLDTCRLLKGDPRTQGIPLLLLSSASGRAEIVAGLKAGADDCLGRPFYVAEAAWRVRGLLLRHRASPPRESERLVVGPLSLDAARCAVALRGRALRLSPKEFALLEALMLHPGLVLRRRQLLEAVWGLDSEVQARAIDLTLFRLRRKLGAHARMLETVPGFGYRLRGDSAK